MANRSLGTLTIDLIAKTGGFVQGMDQAERKSRTWRTAVMNDIGLASKSLESLEFVTKDTAKVQETLTNATQGQKAAFSTLMGIVDNTSNSLAGLEERQRAINTLFGMNAITTQEYVKLTTATDTAKNSLAEYEMQQQQMVRAQASLASQFQGLRNQLDPTAVAFERIAEQQRTLAQAKSAGLVSPEYFSQLKSSLDAMNKELVESQDQLGKTGNSAKQTAFAMRMLPAQMTDIVVGLSTGQSPFMVMMQQGGQLKDMFGGIGPAIKAVATAVMGMINPFTIAAAVVVGLGYAYEQATAKQEMFRKAANSLNNISGLNASGMNAIAQNAGFLGAKLSDASEGVISLSAAMRGNVDLYPQIIAASSKYSEATGEDLGKVIENFTNMSTGGISAIDSLDDKLNFLSESQRKQADEAAKSGDVADAQRIAFSALADKLAELTNKANEGASGWHNFWAAVKNAGGSTVNTLGQIASGTYFDDADVQKYQQLMAKPNRTNGENAYVEGLRKNSDAVKNFIKAQEEAKKATEDAQESANQKQNQQDAIKFLKEYRTKAQQRNDEIERANKLLKEGVIDQTQYNSSVAEINDRYKDPKTPKQKSYTEDAATRLLDQINQQTAALQAQGLTEDKLSAAAQQRLKFETQIATLQQRKSSGGKLTKDEQSLLANSNQIDNAYKALESAQDQVTALSDYHKMQEKVKDKDEQQNDLLEKRLKLLEKVKKSISPDEYNQTRQDILKNTKAELPDSVKKIFEANDIGSSAGMKNSFASSAMFGGLDEDKELDQIKQLQDAMSDYQKFYKKRQEAITDDTLLSAKERNDQLLALEQDKNDRMAAMSNALYFTQAKVASDSFSSITDSMGTMFGQQSAAYKAAFAIQKAFSIATVMAQMPAAMAQALAGLPYPANLVAYANVAALMATIVSDVQSVAAVGFSSGGYTGNIDPSSVAGVVHGQEFVFDAAATRRLGVGNLEAMRSGDATTGHLGISSPAQALAGGGTHYSPTINIPINGNPSDATIALTRKAAEEGAKQGYQRVVNSIVTGQGDVHHALMGKTNAGRKKT